MTQGSGSFVETCSLGNPAGLRVGIKDTIDIAGMPTRCGSRAFADAPPAKAHAAVVQRVLDAGGHIVGKTCLHELAFGITGINDWSGTPVNPRYPSLVPGGSSSGSAAAVAAGEVDYALGTDTGGSVRVPAACCGVWGLKPTFGRVSRAGVAPADTSLDCVGVFARDAAMLIAAMRAIDPTFAARPQPGSPRIGLVQVDAPRHIRQPLIEALAATAIETKDFELSLLDEAFDAGLVIINAETAAAYSNLVGSDLIAPDVAVRLAAAAMTTAAQIVEAELVRTAFAAEIDRALEQVDVLVLPTLGGNPPTLDAGRENRSAVALTCFVRPFNLSGHPALSLPLEGAGFPVGMQIVGRRGADETVCAIGAAIAAAQPPAT